MSTDPFTDDQPAVGSLSEEASANVDAAIASTPASHPDYEKLSNKESAEMRSLLIAYHFAVVHLIEAHNRGEDMEGEVSQLEQVCREAEPFARKHEEPDSLTTADTFEAECHV